MAMNQGKEGMGKKSPEDGEESEPHIGKGFRERCLCIT